MEEKCRNNNAKRKRNKERMKSFKLNWRRLNTVSYNLDIKNWYIYPGVNTKLILPEQHIFRIEEKLIRLILIGYSCIGILYAFVFASLPCFFFLFSIVISACASIFIKNMSLLLVPIFWWSQFSSLLCYNIEVLAEARYIAFIANLDLSLSCKEIHSRHISSCYFTSLQ